MSNQPDSGDWLAPARLAAPDRPGRPAAVDADWYLRRYADVAATGLSAQQHYESYGRHMGRDPIAGVSASFLRDVLAVSRRFEPVAAALSGRFRLRPERVLAAAAELVRQGRPGLAAVQTRQLLPPDLATAAHLFAANGLVMPDLNRAGRPVGSLLSPATRAAWCALSLIHI